MAQVKTRAPSPLNIRQGAVYRDVDYLERLSEAHGVIEVARVRFPLVVVLTQDCDLAQDHKFRYGRTARTNQDKQLISVLVAPIYNAEHVYTGEHMSELGIKMRVVERDKSEGRFLRENQLPRYHYLEFPPGTGIPPSIIDFKHYFSVGVEYLRDEKRNDFVCWIAPLYREEVCHRFGTFLARIGLPSSR